MIYFLRYPFRASTLPSVSFYYIIIIITLYLDIGNSLQVVWRVFSIVHVPVMSLSGLFYCVLSLKINHTQYMHIHISSIIDILLLSSLLNQFIVQLHVLHDADINDWYRFAAFYILGVINYLGFFFNTRTSTWTLASFTFHFSTRGEPF